jgi:hypothetical protein
VYAWRDAIARGVRTGGALNGAATLHAWRALGGGSDDGNAPAAIARRLRTRALVAGFPLAVAALNRAGLGPLRAEISGTELRRAGLRAMAEVAERLGLGEAYVVFGHTHRAGPLARDDAREWRGAYARAGGSAANGDGLGARLVNAGCWTYEPMFLSGSPGESPYWPGTCVRVEDSGPPALERLLSERTHEELRRPPG